MVGQKRKYDESDKIKAHQYYLEHQEEIKKRTNKYYHEKKNDKDIYSSVAYTRNPNTAKNKKIIEKIRKLDEKIRKLKEIKKIFNSGARK